MAKSDIKRAFQEDGSKKTHIGGQALIEGIMMRGKNCWAVAVREPSGQIYTESHDLKKNRSGGFLAWPCVRGCVALCDSLGIGFKALEVSANHALMDEEEEQLSEANFSSKGISSAEVVLSPEAPLPSEQSSSPEEPSPSEQSPVESLTESPLSEEPEVKNASSEEPSPAENSSSETSGIASSSNDEEDAFGKGAMALSMILGIALGLGLFIFLPALVSNLVIGDYDTNTLAWNLVDGLVRVAIFIFYVWLIGRMKDIKRMFAYHGAEHKTIHCYEHGLELTPENARTFPRLHVRCGTAFLIMVMIFAIFIYTLVPLDKFIVGLGVSDSVVKFILVLLVRIVLLPVIAGLSYEVTVKWAGMHPDNILVKIILWPGMQMQRLTTNEPDDEQLECAIQAMNIVIQKEESN